MGNSSVCFLKSITIYPPLLSFYLPLSSSLMRTPVQAKSPETVCLPHYVFGVKLSVKKCTGPLGVVYQPLTHTLLTLSFL